MPKTKLSRTARLLTQYSDLLNTGRKVTPAAYARQHPVDDPAYRDLLDITYWLRSIKLEARPIPRASRQRILRRVLMPRLRRAAEKLRARVAEVKDQTAVAPAGRIDILLVLLYLKGRTDKTAEAVRGITRLMKLLFLVQQTAKTAPPFAGWEYLPGRFGPYSPEVYDDLQIGILSELIKRTEFDEDGMPVTRAEDYGAAPETSFSGANALYELTAEGKRYAAQLVQYLKTHDADSLRQLTTLKQQLARMRWQQIVQYVYKRYPAYTTESELLKEMGENSGPAE